MARLNEEFEVRSTQPFLQSSLMYSALRPETFFHVDIVLCLQRS